MKRNILVLVDMQYSYVQPNQVSNRELMAEVIESGIEVIKAAKERGDYIILLQYKNMGATIMGWRELVKGYKDRCTVWKGRCDGSGVIRRALKVLGIKPLSFTVIGLYSGECVRETVSGLLEIYERPVTVVKSACFSWLEFSWKRDKVFNNKLVRQI